MGHRKWPISHNEAKEWLVESGNLTCYGFVVADGPNAKGSFSHFPSGNSCRTLWSIGALELLSLFALHLMLLHAC